MFGSLLAFLLILFLVPILNKVIATTCGFINGQNTETDLCLLTVFNYADNLLSPLFIVEPKLLNSVQFISFIDGYIQNNTLQPYSIYNNFEQIRITTEKVNILMFITSIDEITPYILNKLNGSNVDIFIVYSNKIIQNGFTPEIEKVFDLFGQIVLKRVFLLVQRNSKKITWRIYVQIDPNCDRNNKYQLIGLCRGNETHASMTVSKDDKPFHTCPLYILLTIKDPFVLYSKETGFYSGIEISLARTLAEKLNLNFTFILNDNSASVKTEWVFHVAQIIRNT